MCAPVSAHSDDEVKTMSEDIAKTVFRTKTHFHVVIGDFNTKRGARDYEESRVGPQGYRRENASEQKLVNFLEEVSL